ncbi:M3 family metallopeptidase [Bacteroides propionicifaciens]|uniref:M3 family metallopeptidase n=1 Tax=Bacteroides propionicifaciens TaxID=392838 RepID=UPI000378BDEF|nr:M3 family metallopeptidase [Bacteroides propionicifaciens]
MKKTVLILAASCMMYSCSTTPKVSDNPLLSEFTTEFGAPPFQDIKLEHYKPAFEQGFNEQNELIEAITKNAEAPTFENVIVALDNSSPTLDRVSGVFFNLTSAESTPELQALSGEMMPILTGHGDNIYLNAELFDKVNQVYQNREALNLTTEQNRLLEKTYMGFVRSGANLDAQQKERLKEINKELASLGLKFGNNLLGEDNSYKLFIENEEDLAGLPQSFIEGAAEEAKAAGQEGKWLVTLHNSSRLPFLQYAANRDLREELFTAYINRGNNDNEFNNKQIITDIVKLRLEKANLLGYDSFSNFVLDRNMAKDSKTVMDFLNNLWGYALPNAKAEAKELQVMMDKEGKNQKLEAWDWWYYTTKLREAKFDLNEDDIKPYFKLENVRDGAFDVASKLYGITFTKLNNIPVYHSDVEVFEVKDLENNHIGLFYVDYFPRPGKRGGAWMSSYRDQKGDIRPLVCNVGSFTKPTATTPSLLTIDEVETLFHELGHGLHGLLTNCNYAGVSGTSVSRDFVELPSQINEHWAFEPEVLKSYAKHYQTGEIIPDELIEKIQKQSTFNEGFRTTELLAASILDMNLHNLTEIDPNLDVVEFENQAMKDLGLISQIPPRYRTTYFNHIVGGYAAGYYSYLWANVLDSDAFEAFKENGIFDAETANKFKTYILEKGDSEDPMTLYVKFRGAEPKLEPMLKNRGLLK